MSTFGLVRKSDAALGELFRSGKYADLTFQCGDGREFKVHKVIVCAQSKVLTALCDSSMIEGRSGIIRHAEFDNKTVERMFLYLYTNNYDLTDDIPFPEENLDPASETEYPDEGERDEEEPNDGALARWPSSDPDVPQAIKVHSEPVLHAAKARAKAHIRVYAIGDYYNVQGLKELASACFGNEVEDHWSVECFVGLVKEVYSITGPDDQLLRNKVFVVAANHATEIVGDSGCLQALSKDESLQDFVVQLLTRVVDKHKGCHCCTRICSLRQQYGF